MNKIEEYRKINDLPSLMEFMNKYIQYGFVDISNNIHVNELKGVRKLYKTSDIPITINSGVGTCIEQTRIIRDVLNRFGYETKLYCILSASADKLVSDNDVRIHSFVLAFKDDKCVYFEHPNYVRRGIHVFDKEDDALEYIHSYYKDKSIYKLYLIDDVPIGLSFDELISYVKSFDLTYDYRKK